MDWIGLIAVFAAWIIFMADTFHFRGGMVQPFVEYDSFLITGGVHSCEQLSYNG
jgi:hypothetical protein